jgi:hypothetical protein
LKLFFSAETTGWVEGVEAVSFLQPLASRRPSPTTDNASTRQVIFYMVGGFDFTDPGFPDGKAFWEKGKAK